jgi:hypothetical protein
VPDRPFCLESREARVVLDHPDVHRGSALGLLIVAIGCGTHIEPADGGEPSPGAETSPPPSQRPHSTPEDSPPPVAAEPQPPETGGGATPAATCTVGFQKDVLPRVASVCGTASCHGGSLLPPSIDSDAPKATYDALMAFGFGSIEWSLGEDHPTTPGASEPAFRTPIDAWRFCKAKFD